MSKQDFTSNDSEVSRFTVEKRRNTNVNQSETQATSNARNEHYTVGWICAITTEYVAAQVFLDEKYEQPEYTSPHDNNDYTLGRIGPHNVVIAVLPDGEYGISSAATTARDMLHSFPNIKIGLMVGIGGGSPSRHDIRLGDVVVSASRNGKSAVLQYDFGKTVQQQRFRTTGYLNQPPVALRTAMNGLRAQYEIEGHELEEAVNKILEKKPRLARKFRRPDASTDILYQPDVLHPSDDDASCKSACGLDSTILVKRPERVDEENTKVHYGLIASANRLMKHAMTRDSLAAENDVLCYEMEAAGLMNHFPCLVIRGICDYSDSHKNKEWQGYAAMVAAAYTKDLLYRISPSKVEAEKRIGDILADVRQKAIEISEDVKDLLVSKNAQERDNMLEWLSPDDYALQQSDFNGRRQEGTGQWFLRSPEFQEWMNSRKLTLFCPGIPGAGKTIITSLVVDEAYTRCQKDPSFGFAYLYCDFRRQNEQGIVSLLANLLKQLSKTQHPLPEEVQHIYLECKTRQKRPSPPELVETLGKVIARYSKVHIIIDALDECQVAEGCRRKLLSELFSLQEEVGINIFCTSRPIPEIVDAFKGAASVEIRAKDEDLHQYLSGNLVRLPSFVMGNAGLQKNIRDTISNIANGMFLLATLHIDSLAQQPTIGHIRRALKTLPSGLNDTYDQAMARIESQSASTRGMAKKVLSWVIHALRPLSPTELQHAIAIQPGQTDLDREFIPGIDLACSICAGLVTIDNQSNIIRLVHYTTQECFDQTKQRWFTDANFDIASDCITYLSFNAFASGPCQTDQEFQKRIRSNRLYHYAALNWAHHVCNASALPLETLDFLKRTQNVEASSQVVLTSKTHPEGSISMSGLHMAAYFGISEALKLLLCDQQPDVKDSCGRTPLWWAVFRGHEMTVELLLQHGADPKIRDGANETPLLYAARLGQSAIVKQLIGRNANTEGKVPEDHMTALSLAARSGHTEVVKVFLELGTHPGSKGSTVQTLLAKAALSGHTAIVKMLLESGADIDLENSMGRTPLALAVMYRRTEVVKMLLESGANPDSKGSIGQMPLAEAAAYGGVEICKMLLELGADPDSENWTGRTPLARAASEGHYSVVELLLQTGVRPDKKDFLGHTPLSQACSRGNEAIVKLLLKHDVDIEQCDDQGNTPMSLATRKRHLGVLEVLLDHGANTEAHNLGHGRTPLIWAAERGYKRVVEILLSKGADQEARDNGDQTALDWAKTKCHKDIEELLLKTYSVRSR